MTVLNRIAEEPWQTKALLYLAWCSTCVVGMQVLISALQASP